MLRSRGCPAFQPGDFAALSGGHARAEAEGGFCDWVLLLVCSKVGKWALDDINIKVDNCSELQTESVKTANKAFLKPHSLQIRVVSKPQ